MSNPFEEFKSRLRDAEAQRAKDLVHQQNQEAIGRLAGNLDPVKLHREQTLRQHEQRRFQDDVVLSSPKGSE